jgi:hypothetical protein
VPPVSALPKLPTLDMAWLAIPIAILLYVLLLYDARRTGSQAAGDDQLGIKTVAATLTVMGTWVLAEGLHGFLVTILTFDDFWDRLKAALPSLVVGALVLAGAGLMLMSRTNAVHYPKAKRLAAGVVALVSGTALVPALVGLASVLLEWPSWRLVAAALATVITAGVVFVVALAVLGRLSGVQMPSRMPGGGSSMRPSGPAGMGQPLGGVVQPMPPPGYVAQPSGQPPYVGPQPGPYVGPQQPPQG